MTQFVDTQVLSDFKNCIYCNFLLYVQYLKIVVVIQLINHMRKLGKTYITLFGNTIEIDSDTSIENKVSIKAKAVTKVKKELIVPTIFNINYSKNPGKEHELTSEDSDAIFKGKLEDFIRDYNVMYDGQKANFDDKGRVIIDSI